MGKPHERKTNAMRVLDAAGIAYEFRTFSCEQALSGVEVARLLGLDPARVFKTLVTVGKSGEHHVFMVPVAEELDLRKAADAVGNWFAEGWNATVAEANHNLAIVREQGPSALEHALHTVGDAAWNAYNWAAELLGAPALDTPTTPEPFEETTPLPLFTTATPNPSALASASPTPSPTPAPTPSPTPAPTLQPIGRVTVYSVENGTYYHMNDTCRNMEGGIPGTLEDAVAAGLSPCSRCGVPRASILNEEEPLVYLDEEMLYHTSVNCDAFTGAWTPQTLMLAFYRGYEACPVCGADHYVYQPEEPFTQAMDAARHITVYYHDNSTYYHAESSCGSMTGADPHSLAEAVLLDEKERCPSCDPPEIGAEATEAPEPSAQSEP